MSNRIQAVRTQIARLTPAEASVRIEVELETFTPDTELRGKIVGPRCPEVTTVEVAYPLRPVPQEPSRPENPRVLQAVIPEPNLWTRQTPFFYSVTVELWQGGVHCDRAVRTLELAAASPAG